MKTMNSATNITPIGTPGAGKSTIGIILAKYLTFDIARGVYVLADRISEQESFLEAAAAVPHCLIYLLSALQFNEITTQMPMETWIAIERGRHKPSGKTWQHRPDDQCPRPEDPEGFGCECPTSWDIETGKGVWHIDFCSETICILLP